MDQGSRANPECEEFRWPSDYERLMGASAAGRQMHPPFIGSAGTKSAESGNDFPSLIASDMGPVSTKTAAGDSKPTGRRVHFSDENSAKQESNVPRYTFRRVGATQHSNSKTFVQSGKSIMKTRQSTGDTVIPVRKSKSGNPLGACKKSILRPSRMNSFGSMVSKNQQSAHRSTIAFPNQRLGDNARCHSGCSSGRSFNSRTFSLSQNDETMTKSTKNGPPIVSMNRAAQMRQNYIRKRLHQEWYQFGSMFVCPFD